MSSDKRKRSVIWAAIVGLGIIAALIANSLKIWDWYSIHQINTNTDSLNQSPKPTGGSSQETGGPSQETGGPSQETNGPAEITGAPAEATGPAK